MSVSYQNKFIIKTTGRGTYDMTDKIKDFVEKTKIKQGICHIFLQHTSASLIFCENADGSVRNDLETFTSRWIPDGDTSLSHHIEGPDDISGHLRTMFTQNSLSVPIYDSELALGIWQAIFLWEHRCTPHQRHLIVTILS